MADDDDDEDEGDSPADHDLFGFDDEPPLAEFEAVARDAMVQNTARLTEAMCEVFPDGWKDDWTKTGESVVHKDGMRGQLVAGAVVTSQGPGVLLTLTLKAQAHALLVPAVAEEALALRAAWQDDALRELMARRVHEGEDGMCAKCVAAYEAAMDEAFYNGWSDAWRVSDSGYAASHGDGWEVTLDPDATPPMVLKRSGAPVANLRFGAGELTDEGKVFVQGIALLSDIDPRLFAMAMTPHHQHEAALAQGALPDEMRRRAISKLIKLFEDGWRSKWRADPKAGTATHISGIVASLIEDGVQVELDSAVNAPPMEQRPALILQARAVIEGTTPEETIERVFRDGSKAIREMALIHEAESDIFSRFVRLVSVNTVGQ